MAFIPHTPQDVAEMLKAIGVADVEELFSDIPASVRLDEPPGPEPMSEYDALRLLARRAATNKPAAGAYQSFIGAGSYEHVIPAAVGSLASRGEFLTAYTPYQPEASQGTLQVIYEFQSMICALTGMEAANASMYDGASSLAEAVIMAARATERNQVVLPATLHPAWREVVETYISNLGIEIVTWGDSSTAALDPKAWPDEAKEPAALVIAQPNFYGWLEDAAALAEEAHKRGALAIAVAGPMSLSVIEPPAAWGADVAVGEIQPLGLPMNFGGPYAGFFATRKEHMRRMPGRIVGQTVDDEGRLGYVLTLQTREQHIRRERATSNICTNEGLCAAMATFWMSLVGKRGFVQLGEVNLERAGLLFDGMKRLKGVAPQTDRPFFNEFTVRLPFPAEQFCAAMRERGVLAGLPASRLGHPDAGLLIVCATETKSPADIDAYLELAKPILEASK
ncbi:MAG: aminomethyl-transferring glycine dehydrogenase subunit GcvPA [Candidatus Sumerlaeia bacterium]